MAKRGPKGLGVNIRSSFVFKSRVPAVRAAVLREATARGEEVANRMYDELIEEMYNTPPGGNVYPFDKKNWSSGEHMASMEGEYPAVWYEDFMNSIGIIPTRHERAMGFALGSDSIVGQHLEFGTLKMEPRPWLAMIYKRGQKIAEKVFLKRFDNM